MPDPAPVPGPVPEPELNATAASLLGFLQAGEASGYELVGIAQQSIGDFWSLTRSQVYRELSALAGRGLVTAGPAGRRARRPYTITDAGRAAFTRWLDRAPEPEQIRYPLLLTVSFGAALRPGRIREFVAGHRVAHERRLADYLSKVEAGGLDRHLRATLAFGIRYERAVLAWMDELPSLLDPGPGSDSGSAASPADAGAGLEGRGQGQV
ncbi:PadR family transcriptional regulator [Streptomyces specialis]|uniref:PadR family transcriptional regulator n=1 Tax=Streptomyces specialis TaxID=498367 RepID=UPI00099EEBAA|nr:PadR family transcriptional regulator [Streptomyces specialis]